MAGENEDPAEQGDDSPPVETPPANPPTKKKPLSSDVVNSTMAKTIKDLQTKISSLEDRCSTVETVNKTYEERLALLAKTPSAGNPKKTLLDEIEEFLGGNPFALLAAKKKD